VNQAQCAQLFTIAVSQEGPLRSLIAPGANFTLAQRGNRTLSFLHSLFNMLEYGQTDTPPGTISGLINFVQSELQTRYHFIMQDLLQYTDENMMALVDQRYAG